VVHSWAISNLKNEIAYYNLKHRRLKIIAGRSLQKPVRLEPYSHPLVAAAISYWDSGDQQHPKKSYRRAISLDRDIAIITFLTGKQVLAAQIQLLKKYNSTTLKA